MILSSNNNMYPLSILVHFVTRECIVVTDDDSEHGSKHVAVTNITNGKN
jgi:hypothetical protein